MDVGYSHGTMPSLRPSTAHPRPAEIPSAHAAGLIGDELACNLFREAGPKIQENGRGGPSEGVPPLTSTLSGLIVGLTIITPEGALTAQSDGKSAGPSTLNSRHAIGRAGVKAGMASTATRALIDQLRAANEQLVVKAVLAQALAEQADASRVTAEAANRRMEELLATVSHELRTPLHTVLAWARLLGRGQLDPRDTAQAVDTIERNGKGMARIIDDLLDMSRIIGGDVRIDPVPVDLVPVVQGGVDEVRLTAGAKGVHVRCTCDAAPVAIAGDASRLRQIVGNLLSNALKFTPSGGRIEVRLGAVASRAEIRVADTGRGIPPGFLPRIFERFARADASATGRHDGLGLGLAIVRALVERHGGSVQASSQGLGHGATFTVQFPLVSAHEPRETEPGNGPATTAQPMRADANNGGTRAQ